MKLIEKTGIACIAALTMGFTSALAEQPAEALPADYEEALTEYVEGRLDNPRSSSVRIVGEPYQVEAEFGRDQTYRGWAVDVRVRSRSDYRGGKLVAPDAVIFIDGRPVALESDVRDMDAI